MSIHYRCIKYHILLLIVDNNEINTFNKASQTMVLNLESKWINNFLYQYIHKS